MKKLRAKFLTAFMILSLTATTVWADENPEITPSDNQSELYSVAGDESQIPEILAESAIVVDMETGYTLVEKNIYDKLYPASITKIMTAILTLEHAALEEVVTFSYDAVFSIEAGSSAAYVNEGEQLTVEECLYGLMLISGNDLANGLAEHIGGSMEKFAQMMTDKAKSLGCTNTNFANAHGLHDENHYTCAYDMALIAKYAYENFDMFRTLCNTQYYECQPTNKQEEIRYWRNNNKLINPAYDQYYEDCIGGKTGFTDQAGGTLVTYANINGRNLLCVVMKTTNSASAYVDTVSLYEYVKNNVTDSHYKTLEQKYIEAQEISTEKEISTNDVQKSGEVSNSNVSNNGSPSKSSDENESADKEDSSEGIWIGWKIMLLLLTVFVIYYVYVRYRRYEQRKKRQEQRRRQRSQRRR